MVKVCPICKGEKVSLKRKYANGVHVHFGEGEDEYETCWMCGGSGEVNEVPTNRNALVTKYWMRSAQPIN